MAQGKLIFNIIAITFCSCVLSTQARPQTFDESLFPVDGFAFDGPADRLDGIKFQIITPRPVTPAPSPRSTLTTTETCINGCQNTSEYNPVCGTDGVIYSNPGRLGCAKRCGRSVELANHGPCATENVRG